MHNSGKSVSFSILTVDQSKCQGHGRCVLIAPEIFDLDSLGQAVPRITKIDSALMPKALLAIANCPEFAISLHDQEADRL